jgi:hypothetical protein
MRGETRRDAERDGDNEISPGLRMVERVRELGGSGSQSREDPEGYGGGDERRDERLDARPLTLFRNRAISQVPTIDVVL